LKEESEWQRTEVSLVTNESHSDKYESEIGGEQATVAWDSNMAGCFIVLDKLEGRPQIKRKQAQGLRLCGCWQ